MSGDILMKTNISPSRASIINQSETPGYDMPIYIKGFHNNIFALLVDKW